MDAIIPITAAILLSTGRTLREVDDMVHTGRISEELANEFFQVWVVGKCDHRWNAELQQPEEAHYPKPYFDNNPPVWRRMKWG